MRLDMSISAKRGWAYKRMKERVELHGEKMPLDIRSVFIGCFLLRKEGADWQ